MAALQNVEVTARWHNIWLGTTVFFLTSTVLFAGLFGGYFTAYQESKNEACFLEMHYWKHFEMLDPSIHSVAFLDGTYYAVPDHTVTEDSCLLKLSRSLQTQNVILPHSTGVGRALQENKCDTCKTRVNEEANTACVQQCTATSATQNTDGKCTCGGGRCKQGAVCTKSCTCDGGDCDQSECPSTAAIGCNGGRCTQNGQDCACLGGGCYNCTAFDASADAYNLGPCPTTNCNGEQTQMMVNHRCHSVCASGVS